jgi:hypothetical protein
VSLGNVLKFERSAALASLNIDIIRFSDISERYFEFYNRLSQRKTPSVVGGE